MTGLMASSLFRSGLLLLMAVAAEVGLQLVGAKTYFAYQKTPGLHALLVLAGVVGVVAMAAILIRVPFLRRPDNA